MNKKEWLKNLLYIFVLILLIFTKEFLVKKIQIYTQMTLSDIGMILLVIIPFVFNLLIGLFLGLEFFLAERKKEGTWNINIAKLVLVGIPSLFLSLYYLIMMIRFPLISDLFMRMLKVGTNFIPIFQIIVGYTIMTMFYKEKKGGLEKQDHPSFKMTNEKKEENTMSELFLAGGCFWGLEKYISLIRGVVSTEVGYANGNTEHPTYDEVCSHNTGHAETVKVTYDATILPLEKLLELYFDAIDPTSLNRQGGDVGSQYRTGIYYTEDSILPIIQDSIEILKNKINQPIAVEVLPLTNYSTAEAYHQHYLEKNPGGYCHIKQNQFQKASLANLIPTNIKPNKKIPLAPLTELQLAVTQKNATEPPFQNEYWDSHRKGIYVDITTGEPLFSSTDKFDSGCGWPSFSKPISSELIKEKIDKTHGMHRTEVRSQTGDIHLGHIFSDGPKEKGGMRYCINSASLRFVPIEEMEKEGYGAFLGVVE